MAPRYLAALPALVCLVGHARADAPKLDKRAATTTIPAAWKAWFRRIGTPASSCRPKTASLARVRCSSHADDCTPKTARELADNAKKTFFDSILATRGTKVVKDEAAPGRRTLVTHRQYVRSDELHVSVALWKDHSERIVFCDVILDQSAKDLEPAFERACLASSLKTSRHR